MNQFWHLHRPLMARILAVCFLLLLLNSGGNANRASAPNMPISHCYHWLDERTNKYLTFKYNHAANNKGQLTFYTTGGNGAVAGPGLYCAKTPVGSYNYGDRVIRIEFVNDVVIADRGGHKLCGTDGKFYPDQSECNKKSEDVLFYSTEPAWYVIKSPQAVKAWSSNSDALVNELVESKLDGDLAAKTHIDLTLQAIQAEVVSKGKTTYINESGRSGIMDIIKDPTKRKQIPPLSLISMIASQPASSLAKLDVQSLYVEEFNRSLTDTLLKFSDYSPLLSKSSSDKRIESALKTAVESVDYSRLQGLNVSVVMAAIDHFKISLGADKADLLWKEALKSAGSLASVGSLGISKGSIFRARFIEILPTPENLVSELTHDNADEFFAILNDFADPGGKSLEEYSRVLIQKILSGPKPSEIFNVVQKATNPALAVGKALIAAIGEASKNKFQGMDPIFLGQMVDKVQAQFAQQDLSSIQNTVLELPLKVTSKLSYVELEEYKKGTFRLPSFYSPRNYLTRLVERSINERSLGNNTTNTFRFILSGMFHFYNEVLAKEKGKEATVHREASEFFLELARNLYKKGDRSYAYIALQNAGFYLGGMQYADHQVESLFARYGGGDSTFDQTLEQVLPTAVDASFLFFLASRLDDPKVKSIMALTLTYLTSDEFDNYLNSNEFKVAQAEKRAWSNVTRNPSLCKGGDCKKSDRISGDICNFSQMFFSQKNRIDQSFPATSKSLADRLKSLTGKICSKPPTS